ncbi:CrcB family protein [Mycetocola manganoxydans]|uniref:Fluoride-specific ion channel FluC n=1 Tax=Mycetocola manganoxydans TaxID=699879 RepID=A0A3L6ZUP5_9MICO|nr:CrcB family protein [Mycetocola manganoxydans]
MGLVILGGTVGTAARELLTLSIPDLGGFPLAIFLINVVGSFALGLLLERLGSATLTGSKLRGRLLLGTGFLGGFTTYSALATHTAQLFGGQEVATGILYAIGTLVTGLVAAIVGIRISAGLRARDEVHP